MFIPLSSPARKACFGAGLLLLAALYLAAVGLDYAAFRYSQQPNLASLNRAVRLSPWNASYWNRLGRALAFAQQEFGNAVPSLERATRLNPYSAPYWIDLATAYQFSGQRSEQRDALEQALRNDPRNPQLTWEAANYFFVLGEADRGLDLMRASLESQHDLLPRALDLALRVTNNDLDRIFRQVIPPRPLVHVLALRTLISRSPEGADKAWSHLIALHQPFNAREVQPYLDNLYQRSRGAALRQAWSDMTERIPELARHRASAENLLVNPGFELEVLNFGLDWRYAPHPGLLVQTDFSNLRSGTYSLLLRFDSQRITDTGFQQLVPVTPGACYQFSGFMKTRSMEGASGLKFLVRDAHTGQTYFASEGPLGTHAWSESHGTFRTSDTTEFVRVSLGRTSNTIVRGEAWVDDLSLAPSARCGG
ncbi:MAG: hypothetical protein AB7O65_08590 [Candidatus Korobacteraceae bacterium]